MLLRHVAMVAKFLYDNPWKRHFKSGFALFQTSSMLFNFIYISECWRNFLGWVGKDRPYLSSEKEKAEKILCCVHLLHKGGALNKDVSCRSRAATAKKWTKKPTSCCFADINLLLFSPFSLLSPSSLLKLHFNVIKKSCCHGNGRYTSPLYCCLRTQ